MRKNFGVKTWLCPQPVIIIGTYDKDGKPNIMNAAWGGICDYDKVVIDLGEHKTTANIAETQAFTVAFGTVPYTAACDYAGIVSGTDVPDKFEKSGFTCVKSEFVNAPVLNELPVTLECVLHKLGEDGMYIGRIVNVSAGEEFLGEDGLPDYAKFTPISFDPIHSKYLAVEREVGEAFSDGKQIG